MRRTLAAADAELIALVVVTAPPHTSQDAFLFAEQVPVESADAKVQSKTGLDESVGNQAVRSIFADEQREESTDQMVAVVEARQGDQWRGDQPKREPQRRKDKPRDPKSAASRPLFNDQILSLTG